MGSSQTADSQLDTSYGALPSGIPSGTQARAHGGPPHGMGRGPKLGRVTRSARPGRLLVNGSADQAAIPLALALASSIAMFSSSWSKPQKPIAAAGPTPGAHTGNGPAASRRRNSRVFQYSRFRSSIP